MRNFTFKRQLLFVMFMLLGCLSIQAADDDLITKQITIKLDKSSEFGYFENIVEFDATGIDKVTTSTDAKELSRYSVNGQRLSAPAKGLNIVKYSDGSVKKVVVQ